MGILSKIAGVAGNFMGDTAQNKQPLWKKLLSLGGNIAGAAGGPVGNAINATTTAITAPTPPLQSDITSDNKGNSMLVQPVEPPIAMNANPPSQAELRQQQQGVDAGFFEGTRTPPPLPTSTGNQGNQIPGVSGGAVEGPGGATTSTSDEEDKPKKSFSIPSFSPKQNAELPETTMPQVAIPQNPVVQPRPTGGFRPLGMTSNAFPSDMLGQKKNTEIGISPETAQSQLIEPVAPGGTLSGDFGLGGTPSQAAFRQEQEAQRQADYNAAIESEYAKKRAEDEQYAKMVKAVGPEDVGMTNNGLSGGTPSQAEFRADQDAQQRANFDAEQIRKRDEAIPANNRYSEELVGGLLRTGQAPVLTAGKDFDPVTGEPITQPITPQTPYAISPNGTVLRQTPKGFVVDTSVDADEATRINLETAKTLAQPPKPQLINPFTYKGKQVVVDNDKQAIVDDQGNVVATLAEAYKDPTFRRDLAIRQAESDLNDAIANNNQIGIAEARNRIAAANYEYERNPPKDTKRSFKDFLKGAALGGLQGLASGKGNIWAGIGGAVTGGAGSLIAPDFEQVLAKNMYRLPRAEREYAATQQALNALYTQEKAEQLRTTRQIINQDKVLRSNIARLKADDVYQRKLRSGAAWTQEEIDALDRRVGFRTGVQPGIRFGGRIVTVPSEGGAMYRIYADNASEPIVINGNIASDPSKAITQITYNINGQEVTYNVTEAQGAAATARIAANIKSSTDAERRQILREKGISERNIKKREARIANLRRERTQKEGQDKYDKGRIEAWNTKIKEIDGQIQANHTLDGVYNANKVKDPELEKQLLAEKAKYEGWIGSAERRRNTYTLEMSKIDAEITYLLGDSNGANPVDEEDENTDNTEDEVPEEGTEG